MNKIALFLLVAASLCAGVKHHYKKVEERRPCIGPEGIDYIYLINLDERPERLIRTLSELGRWGVFPQRFPAIYGWTLMPDELNDMALKFQHGMWTGRECVMHFPFDKKGEPEWIWLGGASYGKACFSGWTVKGTIGCTLSHLSLLKDAYDAGYQTIWILEDDIVVRQDPHVLTALMEELDALLAPDTWDVLYTDFDWLVVDPERSVEEQVPLMWRPDMPFRDVSFLAKHTQVGEKFVKIGSRMRAHSIIYRRSGLEKIVGFYEKHDNFLPYDQEIALIPGVNLYVVKSDVVSYHETTSDTRYRYFQR
jgi:hypothetical protein